MPRQRRSNVRRHATLPQSWIHRENWEFETHRRDLGYAVGAVLAGLTADAFGLKGAMWVVAVITFLSGVIVGVRMDETLQRRTA